MILGGIDNNLAPLIRVSDSSLHKNLHQLDLEELAAEQDPAPSSPSYPFRRRGVLVQLRPSSATTLSTYRVFTGSFSETELSFLHGSFVHNKSQCVALLKALNGATHAVAGRERCCTHIDDRVHEAANGKSRSTKRRRITTISFLWTSSCQRGTALAPPQSGARRATPA